MFTAHILNGGTTTNTCIIMLRLSLAKAGNPASTYIYSIICLKSVDVRTMQFVILAHSPREMSQTDRIHPRYFLLRVRVSIRPRYFVNAKKP